MPRLDEYRANVNRIDADLNQVYRRYVTHAYAAAAAIVTTVIATYLAFALQVLPRATVTPFPVWFFYSFQRIRSSAGRSRELRGLKGFYERGIGRLQQRWMGQGDSGEQYVHDGHLYALDLELFGEGSVFELLRTSPTALGARTLAEWLQTPAGREVVLERQQAVRELIPQDGLRSGLSLAGDSYGLEMHIEALRFWLNQPDMSAPPAARVGLAALTLCFVVAAILWQAGILAAPLSYALLAGLAILQFCCWLPLRKRIAQGIQAVALPSTTFRGLAAVFSFLETRQFSSPLLRDFHSELLIPAIASRPLRRLRRLVRWLEQRDQDLFAYPSYLLMWATHWSLAIEAWRRNHGQRLLRLLDGLGTFEAICSLATFAYERPENCFPELIDGQ